MGGINSDAPDVKIIPPLVYLAGIVIGSLANIWMPIKVVPTLVAGGWRNSHFCGAALTGSAVLKVKDAGTTVRPDRAASTLVIAGPYKITRNPMYIGLCVALSQHYDSGSVHLGTHPLTSRISYHPASGNRTRRGISEKAFWRRLCQLQGKGQALDITAAICRWSYPSLITC